MSIKNKLQELISEIDKKTEKQSKKRVQEILRSYEIQTFLGISRLEAFTNSINNTSLFKNRKYRLKEIIELENKMISRGPIYRKLCRYRNEVMSFHNAGVGLRPIAKKMYDLHHLTVSFESVRKFILFEKWRAIYE